MKKTLGQIIGRLEAICEMLDEDDHFLEQSEITELMQEVKGELTEKTDHWIGYLQASKAALQHAEEQEKRWQKKRKSLERIEQKMKDYLIWSMRQTALPELKGADGRIKLYKNSQGRLNFTLPVERLSLNHTLSPLIYHEISTQFPQFFQEVKILNVDADAIKKSIMDGKTLEFANIEFGQHVRIL